MESQFVKLDNDEVIVKIKGSSRKLDDVDADSFYMLLLEDILKVINVHHLNAHGKLNCSLCPRWARKNENRRDIHITQSQNMFSDPTMLGVVRITNNYQDNEYKFNQQHSMERSFRLSFISEGNRRFVNAEEFYHLYSNIVD